MMGSQHRKMCITWVIVIETPGITWVIVIKTLESHVIDKNIHSPMGNF